jgi:hypothetical protein
MNEELTQTEITKTEETPKVRKRKFDPESTWAKCKTCLEPGNLDNLIRQGIPVKNSAGVEFYKAFRYVYFCSVACQGLLDK